MLKDFSFGFPSGKEIYKVDPEVVLWREGPIAIAIVIRDQNIELQYGNEPCDDGGVLCKHRVPFSELDLLTAKCIALEWYANGA